MSSSTNNSTEKVDAVQPAIIPPTNTDRLAGCSLDMRTVRIEEFIHENLALVRLFVITLIYKDTMYNVCMNNHVTVMDLIMELITRNIVTKTEALNYELFTGQDEQAYLNVTYQFNTTDDGRRFYYKVKQEPLSDAWISITQFNNKSYKIEVNLQSETVAKLKKRIHLQQGICVTNQRLMHKGKSLEDARKLSDYDISNGDTIYLLCRMRKPVIRLRTSHGKIVDNVSLSIELDAHTWQLSSVYPKASITDQISFVQWSNMQVHGDGRIVFKSDNVNEHDRSYPSISDEQEYRMLFWEAFTTNLLWDKIQEESLCVPRMDFARILNYLLKRMSFSSEDRDDLLTFVLPQLDEADTDQIQKKVVFSFLPPNLYSTMARLIIRPIAQQIIRVYMIFGFADPDHNISTLDELNRAADQLITPENSTDSGLIVHEWGTMFLD